jgi:hypothetical protein
MSCNFHCCFVRNTLMCLVDLLSKMFIFGLNLFEVRSSNCILYALKMLMSSTPEIGLAKIIFAL